VGWVAEAGVHGWRETRHGSGLELWVGDSKIPDHDDDTTRIYVVLCGNSSTRHRAQEEAE